MNKVKVSEATNTQLEWLVASIEYPDDTAIKDPSQYIAGDYEFTTDPAQMWPIIEREGLSLKKQNDFLWFAGFTDERDGVSGPTPLTAAARCYVSSKLGEEVEVPEELK